VDEEADEVARYARTRPTEVGRFIRDRASETPSCDEAADFSRPSASKASDHSPVTACVAAPAPAHDVPTHRLVYDPGFALARPHIDLPSAQAPPVSTHPSPTVQSESDVRIGIVLDSVDQSVSKRVLDDVPGDGLEVLLRTNHMVPEGPLPDRAAKASTMKESGRAALEPSDHLAHARGVLEQPMKVVRHHAEGERVWGANAGLIHQVCPAWVAEPLDVLPCADRDVGGDSPRIEGVR